MNMEVILNVLNQLKNGKAPSDGIILRNPRNMLYGIPSLFSW